MIIKTEKKVCDRCHGENFETAYGAVQWQEAAMGLGGAWGGGTTGWKDLCSYCIEDFRKWFFQKEKTKK